MPNSLVSGPHIRSRGRIPKRQKAVQTNWIDHRKWYPEKVLNTGRKILVLSWFLLNNDDQKENTFLLINFIIWSFNILSNVCWIFLAQAQLITSLLINCYIIVLDHQKINFQQLTRFDYLPIDVKRNNFFSFPSLKNMELTWRK